MRYTFTGDGTEFIEGLPARDLDDRELTAEQKALLEAGVERGLYSPPEPRGRPDQKPAERPVKGKTTGGDG